MSRVAGSVGFVDPADDDNEQRHIAGALPGATELTTLVSSPGLKRVESTESIAGLTLHQCARDGNVDSLRRLLDQMSKGQLKKRINWHDENKLSALHYAARYDHYLIVKLLVERGANVNDRGEDDATPLHYGARYKKQKINRSRSVDENIPDSKKLHHRSTSSTLYAPIADSTDSGIAQPNGDVTPNENEEGTAEKDVDEQPSVIEYLISHGSDPNCRDIYGLTPLHYSAMRGNEVAARDLLLCPEIQIEAVDKTNMTALHLVATHNHLEICRMLIEAGTKLRCVDEELSTPLHLAAMEGNVEMCKLLFDAGEKLDGWVTISQMVTDQDIDQSSPLHLAVENGNYEVARLLIEKGADVNGHRKNYSTALHLAAQSGDLEIVKLLCDHNPRIDALNQQQAAPIHQAAKYNHAKVVEYLLDKGAKIERRDRDNFTPLLIAACYGHAETEQALLKRGADIRAMDKNDKTALYWAAEEDNIEALEVLANHPKATQYGLIDSSDRYDNSPLHIAAMKGYLAIVKSLLDHGAQLDAKNEEEQTPLHLGAKYGRTKVVRELVRRNKMIVNDEDEDSNTALHLAALAGHAKVAAELIEMGADIEARNCNLWTPLDCAAAKGWVKTARRLLDNDSPVDPMDKSKTTPLHLASSRGHADMVKLLLAWNASVEQRDSDGNNCLDLAIDNNFRDVATVICESDRWEEALRNETSDPSSGRRNTPMRKLIKKMPDVAEKVFMKCTSSNSMNAEHPKYKITFNYEFLDDMYSYWKEIPQSESGTDPGDIYDEEFRLKEDVKPYSADSTLIKKNHPLMIMVQSNREDLLMHPLVTSLLRHKWNSFGRYVYYGNLSFYVIFLTFLTTYTMVAFPPFAYCKSTMNCTGCEDVRANGYTELLDETGKLILKISKWVIISLTAFNLLRELFQIYQSKLHYLTMENFIEWVMYVTAILLVMDFTDCQSEIGIREAWQWQVGAASIFLAWIDLVLFIRKVPRFGIYVVMFTDVFRTFLRFFVVFVLFILAFAFAFYMLLQNQVTFNSFGKTLVKTMVMMIGEMEYEGVFHTLDGSYAGNHFYPITMYILFVGFLIVMSIIIMNLLVGLAVDDIKAVQEQAVLKRLAMQVELALEVEGILPQFLRRKFIRKCETIRPNKRMGAVRKFMNWESTLSASTIAQALNPELDDIERIEEQQEVIQKDIGKMRLRLKNLTEQNETIMGMMRKLMEASDLNYEDDDQTGDQDELQLNPGLM
ncbi:transient receptor potential cation channel subfamily A member 1 homolog isoform X1 [Tubulanus polymorphus]|uniref:transient receptor potential cation channel subfamily A member 1 homolog isoform X1 n=1 Tax=Tubulanus polymorphus TaxID=672921 RepID=UPI003DA33820